MVVGERWLELCTGLRELAEGYAATDPSNAWRYRQEVDEFIGLTPPHDAATHALREAEADAIRRRWGSRLRRHGGR